MKPVREGVSKPLIPIGFTLSPCAFKPTNTMSRGDRMLEKSVEEHRPLKKRPVDDTLLKTCNKALPEPKLITVVKTTSPRILETCTSDDIERQGLVNRNKVKGTHQHGTLKREALAQSLLRRRLLREEHKAKNHIDHHYASARKFSLLQRLQEELHQRAQEEAYTYRPTSPLQRNPALVRDLLRACKSSSLTSSLILSNKRPLHSRPSCYPNCTAHRPPVSKAGSRVVYNYAHAA